MRLRPAAETKVRRGHPWVYAESVRDQNREGEAGELAVVYDRRDRFLAIGLYDPHSPLRVRVLHTGKPETVDDAWWRGRLRRTIDLRASLIDDRTTGVRLINGESDGWPGLVLDRYGSVMVLKLYTAAWLSRLDELKTWLGEVVGCERLILRLSRNVREQFGEAGLTDGASLLGEPVTSPVHFLENGLAFQADVVKGQKTGFFLDQRENRARVRDLSNGRSVLNAFSFSGAFSVYAASGGARSVTDLDISAHALESAKANFDLNVKSGAVKGCEHVMVKEDVFQWLGDAKGRYDMILLDPPSLARKGKI